MSTPFLRCVLPLAALFATLRLAGAADAPPSPVTSEKELIAALSVSAPADKALICKRLALCGGKDAALALAPLLTDPQLASWARIALEAIPDAAASDVLRDVLAKVQGPLLAGAINSLGVRRDTQAVDVLASHLESSDAEVASAAAVALGRIGETAALQALEPRLAKGAAEVRSAVAEACILVAENLLATGKQGEAARVYDAVRSANINPQRTVEATRGAILARGAAGVPLLVEQLRSPERAFRHIGLRTARELPGPETGRALVAEFAQAEPERKPALLLALADRGDPEALPTALKAAKAGSLALRLTAVGILERLGDHSSVAPLLEISAEEDPALAQAARSALTKLPGAEVDHAILNTLQQPDEKLRRIGIELAAQRRLTRVIPDLLKLAGEPGHPLRIPSLKALGEMGDTAEIQPLIGILIKSQDTAPVESALAAIGARLNRPVPGSVVVRKALYGDLPDGPAKDVTAKLAELVKASASVKASNANFGDPAGGRVKKLSVEYTVAGTPGSQTVPENGSITFTVNVASPAFVGALESALAQAPVPSKPALLRVLGTAGGPKALAVVRSAMKDPEPGMREAAFGALCQWPDAEALPDLKELVRQGPDLKQKVLAMRGYVRLVSQVDLPNDRRLEALKEAMGFAPRDEERKLVLGALGGIRSPQALKIILPQLEVPALKEEACAAAVSVAENFRRSVPPPVAEAMARVAGTTANPSLAQRAKALAAGPARK